MLFSNLSAKEYCLELFSNSTGLNNNTHLCCAPSFDGFRFWPSTPIKSVASQQCPDRYLHMEYNEKENATRYCSANAVWAKTNYIPCILAVESNNYTIIAIWFIGYTLSTLTLWIALVIFRYFRTLHCLRNSIHVNFIVSFIIRVMIWYINTIPQLITVHWPMILANIATVLHLFSQTANFFWMFVEGLYLLAVIAWTYSVERFTIYHYCILGWGIPFILTTINVTYRIISISNSTLIWLNNNETEHIKFITIHIPVLVSIIINAIVTAFVVSTLIKKLRKSKSQSRRQTNKFSVFSIEYKKAIKAAVVLIPLLGLSHVFTMFETKAIKRQEMYLIISALLQSTQGFFVSLIYCFLNREVRLVIKSKYKSCRGYLPNVSRVRQTNEESLINQNKNIRKKTSTFKKNNDFEVELHPFRHISKNKTQEITDTEDKNQSGKKFFVIVDVNQDNILEM